MVKTILDEIKVMKMGITRSFGGEYDIKKILPVIDELGVPY